MRGNFYLLNILNKSPSPEIRQRCTRFIISSGWRNFIISSATPLVFIHKISSFHQYNIGWLRQLTLVQIFRTCAALTNTPTSVTRQLCEVLCEASKKWRRQRRHELTRRCWGPVLSGVSNCFWKSWPQKVSRSLGAVLPAQRRGVLTSNRKIPYTVWDFTSQLTAKHAQKVQRMQTLLSFCSSRFSLVIPNRKTL